MSTPFADSPPSGLSAIAEYLKGKTKCQDLTPYFL